MIGSSLAALTAVHTSGKVNRRAIPRAEQDPPEAVLIDRPLPGPVPITAHLLKFKRGFPLAALRPGDRFTTRLTDRRGMVLGHREADVSEGEPVYYHAGMRRHVEMVRAPRRVQAVTLVKWADREEPVELPSTVVVTPGWWEVKP